MRKIYFDYAATTPVDPEVIKAMFPFLNKKFGNSASAHWWGRQAKQALEAGRATLAGFLNADPKEIIFTSSATESNNLVLKGLAFANRNKGNHIIISEIEHDCILNSARWLEQRGFKISYLQVNKKGRVKLGELKELITSKTILVSIMHANNEIGTIQPIKKIGEICRQNNVLFHTDAAQTFGKYNIDVKKDHIDLLTASSHKIYGPKGIGLLYVRRGVNVEPLLHGGGHEFGLRSSTVNVAGVVGFAEATKIAYQKLDLESERILKLRDRIIEQVLNEIKDVSLNGSKRKRLYNNINFSFIGVEGEALVLRLDGQGIGVSSGSACSSPKLEMSHVLKAIGLPPIKGHSSIRISLGRWTTEEDVDYLLKVLPEVVADLRKMSPISNF